MLDWLGAKEQFDQDMKKLLAWAGIAVRICLVCIVQLDNNN